MEKLRWARTAAAAAAGIGLITIGTPAQAAAQPAISPAVAQGYYWRWSDGSESASRTFAEGDYGAARRLPRLVVTAVPAAPSRTVVLQFRQGSQWITEATGRTNSAGVATLALYPYCEADRWCQDTISYRLVVAGQTAELTVRYR